MKAKLSHQYQFHQFRSLYMCATTRQTLNNSFNFFLAMIDLMILMAQSYFFEFLVYF